MIARSDSPTIRMSRRKIRSLVNDNISSAEAVNLVYVTDTQKGINRVKSGSGFRYVTDNKPVNDKETLARIKGLVIPPAWTNVWICKSPETIQVSSVVERAEK